MEEREKEIQVHKDILESEKQAAEQERNKVAVELQCRSQRVKNLRIKYEGLVMRNKSSLLMIRVARNIMILLQR